jgi:hypothetical protein
MSGTFLSFKYITQVEFLGSRLPPDASRVAFISSTGSSVRAVRRTDYDQGECYGDGKPGKIPRVSTVQPRFDGRRRSPRQSSRPQGSQYADLGPERESALLRRSQATQAPGLTRGILILTWTRLRYPLISAASSPESPLASVRGRPTSLTTWVTTTT